MAGISGIKEDFRSALEKDFSSNFISTNTSLEQSLGSNSSFCFCVAKESFLTRTSRKIFFIYDNYNYYN